jgi:hypothetical protein
MFKLDSLVKKAIERGKKMLRKLRDTPKDFYPGGSGSEKTIKQQKTSFSSFFQKARFPIVAFVNQAALMAEYKRS